MKKHETTWLIIADGRRARIFSAAPGQVGLTELHDLIGDARPTREIGTDRPGRSRESATTERHAMAPRIDWNRQAKQQFAGEVAALVNEAGLKKSYDRLVVVAPAEALGDFRKALDKHALDRLGTEIDKDLTKLASHELIDHLADVLPRLEPPPRGRPPVR
ncbi:MAG: host attachment protein [Alphaproteobacteria bacterium]